MPHVILFVCELCFFGHLIRTMITLQVSIVSALRFNICPCLQGHMCTTLVPKSVKYCALMASHYSDIIMGAMASKITGVSIIYSTICSGTHQKKHQISVSLAFVSNSPVVDEFAAQTACNAKNVSIWWCHHALSNTFSCFWCPPVVTYPHEWSLVREGLIKWYKWYVSLTWLSSFQGQRGNIFSSTDYFANNDMSFVMPRVSCCVLN